MTLQQAPWKQQLPLRIVGEPKEEKLATPYGAVPPWHTMEFQSRHTELSWLIQTQQRELASLQDEARANEFAASSLSPSDDDDTAEAEVNAARTRRIPFEPDPVELATRQRLYDFDQFLGKCSQTVKMRLALDSAGNIITESNDARHKTLGPNGKPDGGVTEEYLALEARLVERLGELPTPDALAESLARAKHYQSLVWANMSPTEQQAWIERRPEIEEYLNPEAGVQTIDAWQPKAKDQDLLAVILTEDPDEPQARITSAAPDPQPEGAPVELNLHSVVADLDEDDSLMLFEDAPRVLSEPTAFELWDETQTQDATDPLRTEAFHRLIHRLTWAARLREASAR